MDFSLLEQLVETPGVSGREERVRALVEKEFIGLGATTTTDAMGNLIGHVPGKGPKVALMAHMDEVGFLVSKIEPRGFIRVMPVGGIDPRVFGAQKVMVHGVVDLPGIVGSVPPHLQKKGSDKNGKQAVPIEECFVDLGLPAEQVNQRVKVGDPVTFATGCWQNEHSFFAKALDDRVGLFVMLRAAQKAQKLDCDLYLVASTQEEYGLRGAGPALYGIQPRVALILEGTVASDTPGLKMPPNILPTAQGKGPELRLTDRGMISDRSLCDFLIGLAQKSTILLQVIVKNTGATDATAGQTSGPGVKVSALSLPVRYIHAPTSMVAKIDIAATVDLAATFLENVGQMPSI